MKTLNKKLVKQISKMLLVLLSFNLVATSGIKASAATNAAITYTVTGDLTKGNTVKIALNVKDATNLYGASWDLAYDKTLLEITSITKGTVFSSDASVPVKNYGDGKAEYALTLTGDAKPAAASGTIAIIEAKVLKDGNMTLKTSSSNNDLSATGVNCRVKLANTPGSTVNADIPYTATDKVIPGAVNPVFEVTSFTSNKLSGQPTGTAVTFTANAKPANNVQYQFYVKDGAMPWATAQSYSTKNTFTWTPTQAGNYVIRVKVRLNNTTTTLDKDINFTITGVNAPTTITSFNSNKASGQPSGTNVIFTAKATPSNNVQYQFYVKDGAMPWASAQAYSTKNTFSWTPTHAGAYVIRVKVKQNNSSETVYKDVNFTVTGESLPTTTIQSFTSNKASGQVAGTSIRFTATATPSANTIYQFYVKNGANAWETVQAYSSKNTLDWKPTKAGTYTIRVRAKQASESTSMSVLKDMQFVVK